MRISQIIISEGQRWPDSSNSLAKRSAVATNLKGAPSKAGRGSGMTVATRVEPTITSTKVQRKDDRPIPSFLQKEGSLNELAPSSDPNGGNYLKALASAWYNGTFNTGDLHKGIKSQEDVERILERGIHCGDGKVRKYSIGYNAAFDGVEIQSDDHYEYADSDDAGRDIDSRTGQPWGPYDAVEFHDRDLDEGVAEGENWSKHNNPRAGGMSKKSVKSYRRSHPGSKIQTAVTTKPSKLKKGSKSAKRRASFCARMRGMKKHRTGAKTARDPNSNINKSLRRWNCESIEQLQELVMIAEQKINEAKNPAQQAAIAISKKKKDVAETEQKKDEDYIDPPEADYDDNYQDMVKRVGSKAKQQELAKQKSKEISESTNELNKILRLSGNKK